jgi:hypothetical protein
MRLFTKLARCAIVLLTLATTALAAPETVTPRSAEALAGLHYKAVLIAGDRSSPAFDHATEAMQARLLARQTAPADIQRLSASRGVLAQHGVRVATLDQVLLSIEQLHPSPGQGCLVFATSHGAYQRGLVLMPSMNVLTSTALATALARGCGDAPTVVIISGCFSGGFTKPPMARANRVILTAAREDRPSFGCGVDSDYTFYDRCLLQTMDRASIWRAAYPMIQACVLAREKEMHERPSEPQAWFGDAVPGMPIPR